MSKKSKKYATEEPNEVVTNEAGEVVATLNPNELVVPTPDATEKPARAPRIVRPRFELTNDAGSIKFTHYALPTRRQASGKVLIDGNEVEFIVTKSQSRDKTEDRAYSYFTLPNGATGYVSVELKAGDEFTVVEKEPAPAFGRVPKEKVEGGAATLPRAEMPQEA